MLRERRGGSMRQERGIVFAFWGWILFISVAIFSVMVYAGMLDGLGQALFELMKDSLRFLID